MMKRLAEMRRTPPWPRVGGAAGRGALVAIIGGMFLIASLAGAAAKASQPNLILIVTDDQGGGDLACHGNPVIETPHLDAMAGRGAQFSRFYVSPVCSPTRACLMTGRYNYRTRVTDTFKGHSMMEPAEETIAEVLGRAGYATGIFGKWHLGDCYPMRAQDQGFQVAVTLRGGGLAQPSDPLENGNRYTDPILWRNGRQFQAEGYCTDVFFDEAIQFIETSAATRQPFFAYLATNAPHGPFHDVPERLYRKYKAKDLTPVLLGHEQTADTVARVFAMVENIDDNVGRLFARLNELQIADDTLVMFLTDNGPNTERYVGERRGMKTEVLDGGIRSPLFAVWPGRIQPGTKVDHLAAHIDVFPTLLAVAEVEAPSAVQLDGRSLLPLLTNDETAWEERTLFFQTHRGGEPVEGHNMAAVTERWKLVRPTGFERPRPGASAPFELYDLAADPVERRDQSRAQPAVAEKLRREYADWFDDVSHSRTDNYSPPRIVVGSDDELETVLTWQDWQTNGPNWGEQGEWLIRVVQPTVLKATVILESPTLGEATLSIGASQRRQTADQPRQRFEFEDVQVSAGDFAVSFQLAQGEKILPPYQIVLSRQR